MSRSNTSSAYSDQWELSEPFTIWSKDKGELCTPHLWVLPCGDLLVVYSDDGDFYFARSRALRSCDGGASWQEEGEMLSAPAIVEIDKRTTRMYEFHSFAVKDSNPKRYLFRYRDSQDGGKTFGPIQFASYEHAGEKNPRIGDGEKIHTIFQNIIYWEDVLTAAGWEKSEWLDVEGGFHGLSYHTQLIRFLDGSLGHVVNLQSDGGQATANWQLHLLRSTDGGINWHHYSRVTPDEYPPGVRSNASEGCPVRLPDGRLYLVYRYPPDHRKVRQTWSEDDGRTWSTPTEIDDRVCGIVPAVHRLSAGVLMLLHGRPGMWITFDPSGTARDWEIDNRFDLTQGENLTIGTNAKVTTARLDLLYYKRYYDSFYWWARQDIFDGYYYSWENVNAKEVQPGRILAVYDLQNWVETPSSQPRKAIRGVWLTKQN